MTLAPLGDSALVISWSEELDDAVLARVSALADAIARAALPGVLDIVPAFSSVTVHFDLHEVGSISEFEKALLAQAQRVEASIVGAPPPRSVEIPVCYGGEFGPDLDAIARHARLTRSQAIAVHAEAEYRVHAIGFMPGFGYLGGLPAKLHTPRRATPRASVAAGSVGVGGAQTGVYPATTPGGWNIIGRTPLRMFDLQRSESSLLRVGDRVVFRPITEEEFARWT
jgi:inhibitor of KinA